MPILINRNLDGYTEALRTMPPAGGGGCHAALLGIATRGLLAGLDAGQIFRDIRGAVHGSRTVSDKEISQAIAKAGQPGFKPQPHTPAAIPGPATLAKIIQAGRAYGEADLWEVSPVRLTWEPEEDAANLLRHLYATADILFIGGRESTGPRHVRTVAEWLKTDLTRWPHIAPNPMTGNPAPGKADPAKLTYRGDNCIAAFRYCVVEFDGLPLEDQLRFWAGVNLPVAALITSGGKSVHGWLRVDVADAAAWDAQVRPLYKSRLVPLGVDGACANPARLSRLPGHFRQDKGQRQRLLFLDPAARGPRFYLTGGGK